MYSNRNDHGLDWPLFSLYLAMLAIGWLMVYAVGYGDGYEGDAFVLLSETIVGKQTIWIALSFLIMFLTQILDWKFWRTFPYVFYVAGILLLVTVLFLGSTVKGATSWFTFGGFSFQPSEFAKFGTCLALAAYLNNFNTNLRKFSNQLVAFGLIGGPMLLILLQPDAGSALVFTSFLFMLFREGLPVNYFSLGFSGVALFLIGLVYPPLPVVFLLVLLAGLVLLGNLKNRRSTWLSVGLVLSAALIWGARNGYFEYVLPGVIVVFLALGTYQWSRGRERVVILLFGGLIAASGLLFAANYAFNNFLKAHQRERINVWLRPELCDPRGSLYNVLQSKMAIGSGGWEGKGFLQGTMTKLNYVPEQSTDFIFCTIGEEQGFIGVVGIIGLFLLLLYRITIIAERQRSNFSRHFAYGVAGIVFIHVFINIGMTLGLMPIIGIPLPFISYGGSSLMGFTLLLGVLLKLDAHRSEP